MNENLDQKENDLLPAIVKNTHIVPKFNFEAIDNFYLEVEKIVKNTFKLGYHYGPAYDAKPGKSKPPDILYKRGMQFFIDNFQLIFQDTVEIIKEESEHVTFTCQSKMFRTGSEVIISRGEGSCSTDEGRFSYQAFEKISSRQVRESAILRSHKDCVERYFNLSRFFPSDKQPSKEPSNCKPKEPLKETAQEGTFKWKYQFSDMSDPEWFKKQLLAAKTDAEITAFAKQFKLELSCFGDQIQAEIAAVANKRRMEVKK